MFNSDLLDVAIGLVFVFLLYSLFASGFNEAISLIYANRARMLERAIEQMLDGINYKYAWWDKVINSFIWLFHLFSKDPAKKTSHKKEALRKFFRTEEVTSIPRRQLNKKAILFAANVINHPFYRRKAERTLLYKKPSYLDATEFSDIMLDLLSDSKSAISGQPILMGDIQLSVNKNFLNNRETRQILQLFIQQAHGDVNLFKSLLEKWFNDSMERVSGWYKRMTNQWLFFIGIVLAVVFNVDSLQIIRELQTNSDVRELMLLKGTAAVQKSLGGIQAKGNTDSTIKKIAEYKKEVESVNKVLGAGWNSWKNFLCALRSPIKIVGWLITALAIMMGAPFWFDLLNKLVNIRGAGMAPRVGSGPENPSAGDKRSRTPKPNSSF